MQLHLELFTKRKVFRCIDIQRNFDKGKSFNIQCFIQNYQHMNKLGLLRGLKDLESWKASYDHVFINGCYDLYEFYGVVFTDMLLVTGCGAFHQKFDFDARPLKKISRGNIVFDHVTYNVTVIEEKTVASFGWLERNSDGPSLDFVKSFSRITEHDKANAAVRLLFEHIENTYIKPSWRHSLSGNISHDAIRRIRTGIGLSGYERQQNCLSSAPVRYVNTSIDHKINRF
jgi:hypothetical protein